MPPQPVRGAGWPAPKGKPMTTPAPRQRAPASRFARSTASGNRSAATGLICRLQRGAASSNNERRVKGSGVAAVPLDSEPLAYTRIADDRSMSDVPEPQHHATPFEAASYDEVHGQRGSTPRTNIPEASPSDKFDDQRGTTPRTDISEASPSPVSPPPGALGHPGQSGRDEANPPRSAPIEPHPLQ